MLKINVNNESYTIKNKLDELTIAEFEKICFILNNEAISKITKWSQIFVYLGLPEEIVDEFDSFAFIDIIKQFNLNEFDVAEPIPSIEIDGETYVSFTDKLKITVKEMGLIEAHIAKNKDFYIGELMAILFKKEGIGKEIHYMDNHIKVKAKAFRNKVTADKCIPFIGYLSKKMINNFEMLNNESI